MARAKNLTRRTFVAAVPALGLSPQLAAWPLMPTPSSTKPVLHVVHVGSAAEAKERIEAVRHAPGCLRADAYAGSDGRFAIFQTWVSESAAKRFNAEGMAPALALTRLEV